MRRNAGRRCNRAAVNESKTRLHVLAISQWRSVGERSIWVVNSMYAVFVVAKIEV